MSESTSNKIISFQAAKQLKQARLQNPAYEQKIATLDKAELLEEMVTFQEERSGRDELSLEMMVRGRILFRALEQSAETEELKNLTRSYRRHLDYEIEDFLTPGRRSS